MQLGLPPDGRLTGELARTYLRAALDPGYAADAACLAALDGPSEPAVYPGAHASAAEMVQLWTIRLRHLRGLGTRTVGADTLLMRLDGAGDRLTMAVVETSDWHFSVYLDAAARCVGCLAVDATDATRRER